MAKRKLPKPDPEIVFVHPIVFRSSFGRRSIKDTTQHILLCDIALFHQLGRDLKRWKHYTPRRYYAEDENKLQEAIEKLIKKGVVKERKIKGKLRLTPVWKAIRALNPRKPK